MRNTKRLIELLQKQEEFCGLIDHEYEELYELLQVETNSVKETLDYYEKLENKS